MSEQESPATERAQIPFFTKFVATGFYSGYAPIAPGTAGSIVAVALYLLPGFEQPITLSIVTLIVFFVGTTVSSQMEKILGEDPPIVVIDEIVGQWITFLFIPKSLAMIALGFIFFRLYDIFKPPPARQVEKLKNGWGIMLDDIVAGVYANVSVWVVLFAYEFFKQQ